MIDSLRSSRIDLKLGLRMLVRYPGLALVGGLGLSVATAIAAISFAVISTVVDPRVPLDEGDRIVAIENYDVSRSAVRNSTHLHDLPVWRAGVPAIAEFGVYRTVDRNLILPGARVEPVRVAEMAASGFRIARVSPLLGRYVVEDDERPDAPPVVVLGYDMWRSRFAGAPDIVGTTVQLGPLQHTVVGVMPEGFAFPVNNRLWTALRLRPADFVSGVAPPVDVFGRLARGASLETARAQLEAVGRQRAEALPATHEHVRPAVMPYPLAFLEGGEAIVTLHLTQVAVTMLLVVIGANVAMLVYARTATRAGEITVRTALGAGRIRIVAQFFAEALVLAATASAVGLVAAGVALTELDAVLTRIAGEQLPFWMRFSLTPGTVVYVAGLALLTAAIIGAAPAFKVTGHCVQEHLRNLGTGGSSLRLGRTWSLLVVTQVALAVGLLPVVVGAAVAWLRWQATSPEFETAPFAVATTVLDGDESAGRADRHLARQRDLATRLAAHPDVSRVLRATSVPGAEDLQLLDLDRPGPRGSSGVDSVVGGVEVGHFEAFGAPIRVGRSFVPSDVSRDPTAVVVNEAFVQRVLGPGNPLGRRIRIARPVGAGDAAEESPWLEVVGVVVNFPAAVDSNWVKPRVYQPLHPDDSAARTLIVGVRGGDAAALTQEIRQLAVAVDPLLRFVQLDTLDGALEDQQALVQALAVAGTFVSMSTLLLSSAGIYALVSLTVTRRRREIAVRMALGAEPRRVLATILMRALGQVAIGIVVGIAIALPLNTLDTTGTVVVALFLTAVGATAAIGPARQGLRIRPTDALRAE